MGFGGAEDAGVLRIAADRALVFTTDFFPPVVDDPYTYGEIAAANAVSDVFAMGGRVMAALNIVSFPRDLDLEIMGEILAGAAAKVAEAGGLVVGGHTVEDKEIKFGLAVTGEIHPERIILNRGARPGDALVLTKPLGSGLITSSIKVAGNEGPEVQEAIRWMKTLNSTGLENILRAEPHAMTDITGFGFLGHLSEMLGEEELRIIVDHDALPRIPGVERCFREEYRTRGKETNRRYVGECLRFEGTFDAWDEEILLDPQTSGGLLIAVAADRAKEMTAELRGAGLDFACVVGRVEAASERAIVVSRPSAA